MFKLILFLCAFLYVMLQFGADDDALRDGLAGRIAPLMQDTPRLAEAPAPVQATPVSAPAVQPSPAVVEAAYVPAEPEPAAIQPGLTLALPLRTEPAEDPERTPAAVQYVVGSSVNVRLGPSADTESLTRLARGEAVTVLPSETPGWSMIRLEGDGLEGYIASRFLSDQP